MPNLLNLSPKNSRYIHYPTIVSLQYAYDSFGDRLINDVNELKNDIDDSLALVYSWLRPIGRIVSFGLLLMVWTLVDNEHQNIAVRVLLSGLPVLMFGQSI